MKSDIITIAMGELQVAFDNEVMKAVQKVGIDVDKEELLKALELHRSLVRCVECKYSEFCEKKIHRHGVAYSIDFCSYGCRSEKPNNCELQTIRCPKCGRTDYIRDMEKDMGIKDSHYKYKCINCNFYIKTEPTISKMEQVEDETQTEEPPMDEYYKDHDEFYEPQERSSE